ncbi:glycosyltransferase family 9 protein [Thermoactinospora rubra]|uniref:glycosyltransferase family 9 protein n=1 Tax=Thermoactinospora rubra TaxID=1088767 RepID=UPI000A11EF9B|nr:glycosyltransferase family 9 protein [Thermoactinospora rubra]
MSRRVLVVRPDNAGDVLLAGPAIRAVAARAEVALLTGPHGTAAARLLPGVGRVIEWLTPWIDPEPPRVTRRHVEALLRQVAGLDEAIILTSFHQSALPAALLLRLAGVGRITAISNDYPGSLLDVRVTWDETRHVPEPERMLAVVRAAGYEPVDDGRLAVRRPLPPFEVPAEPYVVVHPGVSVPARAWPRELHRQAVEALAADGHRVVVTGGPGERELTAYVAGRAGVDLGGRTSLAELATVLERAVALVAGNTGPAHLAAAVWTPVVSLFAPVVPAERWAPYGVPAVLLGDQHAPCAGSRARRCPVDGHPCLTTVRPDDVVKAIRELSS